MGILTFLRLRRRDEWEPPTVLDRLLASPLQWLVAYVYRVLVRLRGRPFRPPPAGGRRPRIRVVCLADTHDHTDIAVPDGDLLIHAGDLTDDGTAATLQRQIDWLAGLPHRHKIVVSGNHDSWFDESARRRCGDVAPTPPPTLEWKGDVRYLQAEAATLEFAGSRRLNVYGAPDVPRCGDDSQA